MLLARITDGLQRHRGLQRLYVNVIRRVWRVDIESIFDREYYLAANPDVAAGGLDPVFHFLWFGARENRNPHPLFDVRFYKQKYPDIAKSNINPLVHYLRFGGREGRDPHPGFNSFFYRATNPDVSQAGLNPLAHFLSRGAQNGSSPHPDFNAARYAEVAPVAGFSSAVQAHFATLSAVAAGRPAVRPEHFVPAKRPGPVKTPDVVDIVVPVYKGLQHTRACVDSVLQAECSGRFRIVVVNDRSPEPEIGAYLRNLADAGSIILLENELNVGFVRSVNRGISASRNDVVLLNSDTVVSPGWLDRLSACAYRSERAGTVTPFSNNATICSYPIFCGSSDLPPGVEAVALDRVFALVNAGRVVELPSAVGFCMYIKRACLDEVGLFDAESFGLGYGEENDFCLRASSLGWNHLLACDVFVQHAGGISFGPALQKREKAARVLLGKHPGYNDLVQRHVEADPALFYRIAVTAYRIRTSGKEPVAVITHAAGGGIAQHLRELQGSDESAIRIEVSPDEGGRAVVSCTRPFFEFSITLDTAAEYDSLLSLLRACGVARLDIHHVLGQQLDIRKLAADLSVPFVFTAHDYYGVCPQITLSDADGRYCREHGVGECNRCIARRPSFGAWDIQHWRDTHGWLYANAELVIAPSRDTAARIGKYHPEARINVVSPSLPPASPIAVRAVAGDERLRVAVMGTMSRHKGVNTLRRCAELARGGSLPVEFVLIGSTEDARPEEFRMTGPYLSHEGPRILAEAAPHLVWFPTQVPETFSYTLSAAMVAGLPVAVPDLGAFPERVEGRPWSWVLPWDTRAEEWITFFLQIRRDHFATGIMPEDPRAKTLQH